MAVTRQSLLIRAQAGDETSWKDLADLYRPFLNNWLRQQDLPESDRDDLTQEILVSVVKYLPSFQHPGRTGAFRSWLRTIAANRLCDYWQSREPQAPISGGSGVMAILEQVADPDSAMNRRWDEEHDRYVLRCLLDLVEQEFEPKTFRAFRRLTPRRRHRRRGGGRTGDERRGGLRGQVARTAADPRGGCRIDRVTVGSRASKVCGADPL